MWVRLEGGGGAAGGGDTMKDGGGAGGDTMKDGGGGGGGMASQHSGVTHVAPIHVILDALVFCLIPVGHG